MPRVASERKGMKRSIITRSRTRKKTKCAVCAKIVATLEKSIQIQCQVTCQLGSFETVHRFSDCDVHPRMFRAYFGGNFNRWDTKAFEVVCKPHGSSIQFWAIGENKTGRSQYTGLLPPLTESNPYHTAMYVDPRWIETGLFRRWKRICDSQHGECHLAQSRLVGEPPIMLVDTWLMCLALGLRDTPYVALSYVWGRTSFFKTFASDLKSLQTTNAFLDPGLRKKIPQTVLDAISVTQLLGERYLWVDALCIIQDDDDMKSREINNMGFIYANASITIIARQGEDAHYGLRGLRGKTQPRLTTQEIFRLDNNHKLVTTHQGGSDNCPWNERGWTFQEVLFSRRTLSFHNDRAWWSCGSSTSFQEDFKPQPGNNTSYVKGLSFPGTSSRATLSSTIPDLIGFWSLAQEYNIRVLTNPEDAGAGLAGITTVLSSSFSGGFICGIPLLYLDIMLCWQPSPACTRRIPRNDSVAARRSLPSWSWIGWHGHLSTLNFATQSFFRTGASILDNGHTSQITIPRVQWYSLASDSLLSKSKSNSKIIHPINDPHVLHATQCSAQEPDNITPPGWSRFEGTVKPYPHDTIAFRYEPVPKYYYKHESDNKRELWYPVPIPSPATRNNLSSNLTQNPTPKPHENHNFLYCKTQRLFLYLGPQIVRTPYHFQHANGFHHHLYSQSDPEKGQWVGMMQLHSEDESQSITEGQERKMIEVVMISEGYAIEGRNEVSIAEWEVEDRVKMGREGKYEFHNVLWVAWGKAGDGGNFEDGEQGVMYRRGCGRVGKSAWDELVRVGRGKGEEVEVELVLG